MPARKIEPCLTTLNLQYKLDNIADLQLADLVATPIERFVMGKTAKQDSQLLTRKFR